MKPTIKDVATRFDIPTTDLLKKINEAFPGQGYKSTSEMPEIEPNSPIGQYLAQFAVVNTQEPPRQQPIGSVGAGAITTTDEAIQEASYKLTESERLVTEETISVRRSIGDLIYGAAGVELGLRNIGTVVKSEQAVVAAFQEQALDYAEQQIQKTEQAVFDLAFEANEILGKQVAQKQAVDNRVQQMQERLGRMGVAIAKIRR